MKKAMRKSIASYLIAMGLGMGVQGSAIAEEATADFFFSTPFDSCFFYGYDTAKVSGHQAYETAECFTSLIADTEATNIGASKLTLLRYASIWYSVAAAGGVADARAKLASSDEALRNHVKVREMIKSGKLEASLTEIDIDKDGVVSLAEFTIATGEATAAGK